MRIGKCPKCNGEMFRNIRFFSYYVAVCPYCNTEYNFDKNNKLKEAIK